MGFVIHKSGDIFTTTAESFGHGVNVEGVMSSGISATIKARYPEMFALYAGHCKKQGLEVGGMLLYGPAPLDGKYVMNIACHAAPGTVAKYEWIHQGLSTALGACDHFGIKSIALPRIGTGIGGLEWEKVLHIIEHLAPHYKVDVEVWSRNKKETSENSKGQTF